MFVKILSTPLFPQNSSDWRLFASVWFDWRFGLYVYAFGLPRVLGKIFPVKCNRNRNTLKPFKAGNVFAKSSLDVPASKKYFRPDPAERLHHFMVTSSPTRSHNVFWSERYFLKNRWAKTQHRSVFHTSLIMKCIQILMIVSSRIENIY